jgi:hypothetical protein
LNSIDKSVNKDEFEEIEEDDDDKVLYNLIGTCSLSIDEVLKHIIMSDG